MAHLVAGKPWLRSLMEVLGWPAVVRGLPRLS
jgi:hypothetical protein